MQVIQLVLNPGKITYKQVVNHMIDKLRDSNYDADDDLESLSAADEEEENSDGNDDDYQNEDMAADSHLEREQSLLVSEQQKPD